MEYTFRASSVEMPTTILLTEYNLTIKQGKLETVIPYAGISEVILNKSGDKVYKTVLQPESGKPLLITNKYYTSGKSVEDRSRAYSTFVRVLHFHLKDKSKANFTSGNSTKKITLLTMLAAAVGFLISLTSGFLGVVFIHPLVDGVILTLLFVVMGLVFGLGRLPRPYQPTDIPLDFLP